MRGVRRSLSEVRNMNMSRSQSQYILLHLLFSGCDCELDYMCSHPKVCVNCKCLQPGTKIPIVQQILCESAVAMRLQTIALGYNCEVNTDCASHERCYNHRCVGLSKNVFIRSFSLTGLFNQIVIVTVTACARAIRSVAIASV